MMRGGWLMFGSWLLLGGGFAFGFLSIMTIGIFVLPVVLIIAIMVGRRGGFGRALLGMVSGAGIPLLYVAWLNRHGPGQVCRPISGGVECTQQSTPWPWLIAGLALVVAGAALFALIGASWRNARA